MKRFLEQASRAAAAAALCCGASPALAQEAGGEPAPETFTPETAPVPAPAGPRSYTPADFARFAPQTALDMVNQLPGFTIRDAPQERGLGQATANVLLNGRRIGGKSDDIAAQLGRIPAANVVRIDIVDGATLDVPGLSGEVANVISRASRTTGQYAWRPEFRLNHTDPLFTRFELSLSGQTGPVEWTLGLENQGSRSGAGGLTHILSGTREFVELRDDVWTSNTDQPRASARLVYDGPGSSLGNLNLSYRRFWHDYEEIGFRTGPGLPDRARTVTQANHGWEYEIGGDFEFALGPGRLKLVGLTQIEHEPVDTILTVAYADGRPSIGSRSIRIGDEVERIGRAEYRWRGGGADWQLSAEGAFNSLDVATDLFSLAPDGTFVEVPFPSGTGRVEEERYEVIGSYGRALAPNLTMQLSAGGEFSELRQIGPGGLSRRFWRPKGQLNLAWRPDPRTTINVRAQRRVLQLNFLDFLAVVNLNDDRENAGNPDLVPPQAWDLDLEGIRTLGRYGQTRLRFYGRWYDDIVDTIPIGETGESPGNIDKAEAYGVEWTSTLNFDPLGWRGARLDTRLQFQRSWVRDPLTGETREVTNFLRHLVEIGLRHDVPDSDLAWGFNLNHTHASREFRLTEVGRLAEGPVWLSVFAEHKDVFGLTVRGQIGNVLGARSAWDRTVYVGRRTGPIDYIESRNRTIGPIVSLTVRGSF